MYCGGSSNGIDHIVPISRVNQLVTGCSPNHWSNLAPCCQNCNNKKGDGTILMWCWRGRRRSPDVFLKYFVKGFCVPVGPDEGSQNSSSTAVETVGG